MRKIFAMIMMLSLMMASACREKLVPVEPEKPEQEEQTPTPGPGEDEKDPVEEPGDGSGEEPGGDPEPDVLMVFNVSVSEPSSANNDDIALLDELHYALYSNEAENISYALSEEAQPIVRDVAKVVNGEAKLEVCLASGAAGHEFVLILWAQKFREEGQEFYDLTDLRNIKCAGDVVLCNQEERVAYYLTHKFTPEGAEHAENLTLVRPHARLNLGTFAQSLRRPDGSTLRLDQSSISLTGVSTSFNTIAGLDRPHATSYGAAGDSTSEKFTFQMNDVPQKAIIINEIEYPYLALNYFFLADRVDLDFEIIGTPMAPESGEQQLSNEAPDDETSEDDQPRQAKFEGTLKNINVHQNHTTTLIGHFFGSDGRYEYDFTIDTGDGYVPEDGERPIIIGDEDGDGYFDGDMDWSWGLGGDDTPSGGGIGGGGDDYVDPDLGGGDNGGNDKEEQKENIRIETPDAVTWEVYTVEGLLMWADEVRNSTTKQRINMKLFEDLYLEEPWIPVHTATTNEYFGAVDGQGRSIYNLTIVNADSDCTGFIKRIGTDGNQVANLYFHNVNIIGCNYTGVVCGAGEGISNCHVVSGTVQGREYVGGIVGRMYSQLVKNCTNKATIIGDANVGGIIGTNTKGYQYYVDNCVNYGSVSATSNYAGGISGSLATPRGCVNYGDVTGADYVGGISGASSMAISECVNYGNVAGVKYVGGVSGQGNSISKSENHGSVTGNDYVGGIVASGSCTNGINSGDVLGVTYVGGLVASGSATTGTNNGDVTGVTYVGGLVGYNTKSSASNYGTNYGSVKGEDTVGGCVGFLQRTSSNSAVASHTNIGYVEGVKNVGGVIGTLHSVGTKTLTLSQCINQADVVGDENVAGLIGHATRSNTTDVLNLQNNFTSGNITGRLNVDYLVGLRETTINDDGTNIADGEVVIVEAEE